MPQLKYATLNTVFLILIGKANFIKRKGQGVI